MDIKVTVTVAGILCLAVGGTWGAETNLTCVLDAMVARGRVACVTNSAGQSVLVRKVTTVDFFLDDVTHDGVHRAFRDVNGAFEREFTRQMRQRYPSAYATAMRSAGNPHNPALAACWRHIGVRPGDPNVAGACCALEETRCGSNHFQTAGEVLS